MTKPNLNDSQVLHTTDLSIFKLHSSNRPVDMNRVKKIAISMKEEGLFLEPIIVSTGMYVADGQHRLEAAKIAGCGIYYLIDKTVKDIFTAAAQRNRNAKSWSKKDYVDGYASEGVHNYKVLQGFAKKYPMFSLTEQIMLLQNSGQKWASKDEFVNGKLKIGSEIMAEHWANRILRMKEYFPKGYNSSNFVRTLIILFEKKSGVFNFEEFVHKLELRPTALKPCGDKRSYSELIEDIYNYKRRVDERVSLRFF